MQPPKIVQASVGLPGTVTRTGWQIPDGITRDEMLAAGRKLKQVEGAMLWWIGDWALKAEGYGDLKAIAAEVEFEYQTVADAQWVARKFEVSRRRETLPWSFHREVAQCTPERADALLDACEAEGLTHKKLRERKAALPAPGAATLVPDIKYDVIVIDPPWPMEKIQRDVRPNQAGFDYPTMDEGALFEFGDVLRKIAADSCHLFCWTTHKHLPLALRLLDGWGFVYVLTFVWHKPGGFQPHGLPQYNCEFVVYARRGSPEFSDLKAFPCCFEAPRREHSRKPNRFYDMVARTTTGRRIDVFSREPRAGFDQYGNEVGKFAA